MRRWRWASACGFSCRISNGRAFSVILSKRGILFFSFLQPRQADPALQTHHRPFFCVDIWEILATWVSQGSCRVEALSFLRKVLSVRGTSLDLCGRGRVVQVGSKSYWNTCERRSFGERNPIEQWLGILKHRIKRFYERWLTMLNREGE